MAIMFQAILQVCGSEQVRDIFDCGFAVASSTAVVYDWGEQDSY